MKRLLVKCSEYNGFKNILFMMDKKDFRLIDEDFKNEWEILGEGDYKKKVLTIGKDKYKVFSDWSVKKMEDCL